MKVCHVINTLNRGGAETHLFDLVNYQILKGYEIELIVIGSGGVEFGTVAIFKDPLGKPAGAE